MENTYTIKELSQILKFSTKSLKDPRWRRRIGLRATRIGRSLRFLERDINDLLKRGREE